MIRAGKLDQVISISALTVAVDVMGAETQTWTTPAGAPTRAEYMPLRGVERIEANKINAVSPAKLRIRRWSGLTTKHRIIHGAKTYEITGIEDYYRNGRDMVISVEEVV